MLSSETPTLQSLSEQLQQGKTTAVELLEVCLSRIRDPHGQGKVAFTRVLEQSAAEAAAQSDARRASGNTLSLIDGLPISVKDLFDIEGFVTKAGSVVLADAEPATSDAVIVARLRQAGAVIVGTTNMTEFAYSGLGLNPHYGTPLSPWDRATGHVAGGSSSGAAVSVSDGMAVGAIGTDTGGSVRIPAAFCGLVGYKPTASRIDMKGTLPLASHLDSIGPIARSITDCAWLADVMAGQQLATPTPRPLPGLKLGVPNQLVLQDMDELVAGTFAAVCELLEQAGAHIVPLDWPELLELAELNAAGGFTAAEAWAWHCELLNTRQAQYDSRVAVRIRRGESLGEDYIANLAQQRHDWIERSMKRLAAVDVLMMPTVPIVPPSLKPLEDDDAVYAKTNVLVLRNPSVINFLDGCAVSLPCHGSGQPPVGLMLAAASGHDRRLIEIAATCELLLSGQA